MLVKDIMTGDPVCATTETTLRDVALLMTEHDCGAIPIIESQESKKLVGIVTDRDIVCRVVAARRDPRRVAARDCMSSPVGSVPPDTSVSDCCEIMGKAQLRRLLVADDEGRCAGIIALADIAKCMDEERSGKLVKQLSHPAPTGLA